MSLKTIAELFGFVSDPDIPIKINSDVKKMEYNFPISESEAISIADKKLTKVYMKNWTGGIPTYVSLFLEVVDVVNVKRHKFYYIKATGGDISGVDDGVLWDGVISKNGCKKLQCLVDVNTGKYIYIGDKDIGI